MEAALVVVEDDVGGLVDATAAEQRSELVIEQPRPFDLGGRIVHAVCRNAERLRDVTGVVVLLRPHVDHPHVLAAEQVVELCGRDQEMWIGIAGGVSAGR